MPSPSAQLSTLRPDLSQSFMQFDMQLAREGFVATEVAPVIDVEEAFGNVGIIPVDQLLQSPDTTRGVRGNYNRTNFTFKPDTYQTQEHGLEEPVDEKEAIMYRNYFRAEVLAAMRLYRFLKQDLEVQVAAMFNSETNFTQHGAATAKFNVYATATPLADFEAQIQAVYANSGMWPNAAVIPRQAFRHMIKTEEVTSLVKFSGLQDPKAGRITTAAIAEALNIEKVIVPGQAKNTADEGQAFAPASIWDKTKCWVGRICDPNSEDYREVTAARIVHWGGDGSSMDVTMESYPEMQTRAEVIRGRQQYQVKLMYAAVGAILDTCL